MHSKLFLCTLLVPLSVLVIVVNGELEYYQDVLAESRVVKRLTRFLEAYKQHVPHHTHFPQLLKHKKIHMEQDPNEPELRTKYTGRDQQEDVYSGSDLTPRLIKEVLAKPLRDNERSSRNGNFESYEQDYSAQPAFTNQLFREDHTGRGMKEQSLRDFQRDYSDDEREYQPGKQLTEITEPIKDYTYTFDELGTDEGSPFAFRPNDPRYKQENPISTRAREDSSFYVVTQRIQVARNEDSSKSNKIIAQRRAEHDPHVLPIGQKINNDVYFIAVVAGCSAAAMFVLVLISLTWCRLQRGAKAAADVEYPAYGVTGPNKDMSPSGDRRLAQSAQMYHYQHQKQQIIAMENRTAAARDPGSVSEPESDEENEEGDYTVYECPGLAPTGEMEVKNPLFHDDPTPATPATPAQTGQKGDHNM